MNYEETLSTLKAIQASYAPVPFLANSETEPRFVIDSDTREIIIPDEFKFLAVKMDHMSEKIYFEIPRYFDDEDLATKICVVQYINTNGDAPIEAIVAAVDVDTESEYGKIIFRWDVDNYLTRYAGMVSFAVRFYTISDDNRFTYSWNTLPATLPVLDTLDNTNDTVSQNYPTELVQWQFRMSELDRTISDKIAEATVTIDADVKAAQAARKGAEDAEARVNAIVAGNEAYTKQQSHDLFARALLGTAEAAKSITIYPDKGSNVIVTINGFTKQEGSGDASPANIRPIVNGGARYEKYIITGDEEWALGSVDSGITKYKRYVVFGKTYDTSKAKVCNAYPYSETTAYYANTEAICAGDSTKLVLDFSIDVTKYASVDAWKSMLKRRYSEGKPLIVWYVPNEITENTKLYINFSGTGNGHTGACGELTAPLCQGDKFITKVKSGCDKVVVFDGSEDEGWFIGLQNNGFATAITTDIVKPAKPTLATGYLYSNYLPEVSYDSIFYGVSKSGIASYSESQLLAIAIPGITSVEALKQYLAAHPLTVWYRSTNYTPAADIPVSLETHQMWEYTFTGEENGTLQSQTSGVKRLWVSVPAPQCKPNTGPEILCSQAKGGPTSDTADRIQSGTASAMYLSLSVFQGTDATSESANQYLANQLSDGTPVVAVYPLATPITYAHDPVDFIASPDEEGAWVITGEADGTVSAEYNKNVTKAFEDILTRISALELHALGG